MQMMKIGTILGVIILLTVLFVSLIVFGVYSSANDNTRDLRLLHVILRHGARTPADTYPNDPYINETLYPVGWGQLTNSGKLDLYNLGKFLRLRYDKFLGDVYCPEEFYSQATDVDRTIASIQIINAGLWPPKSSQKWGSLNWQPIPVRMEPIGEDHLLLVRKPCAQYSLEMQRVRDSEEIRNKLEEHKDLFEKLTEVTGKKVTNFEDVQDVYSILNSEVQYNLTLPEFMTPYYPDKMLQPTIFAYLLQTYTNKLKRLKAGVLLKKLIKDWRDKKDNTLEPPTRKTIIYGGHDTTVVNLLRTLNVWEPQLPDFSIMTLLEFSFDRITNDFGVEIYLKNATNAEPYSLQIPGCDTFCPLEKLIELTEAVVPVNWTEECKSDDPNYVPLAPGAP